MSAPQKDKILGKLDDYRKTPSNAAPQLKAPPASSFSKEGEKTNIQILFTRLYGAFSNLIESASNTYLKSIANQNVKMHRITQKPTPDYSDIRLKMSNLSETIETKLFESLELDCESLLKFVKDTPAVKELIKSFFDYHDNTLNNGQLRMLDDIDCVKVLFDLAFNNKITNYKNYPKKYKVVSTIQIF